MKTFLIVAAALALSASANATQKYDLTGEWTFEVQTDAGTGSPTFVLKQQDGKVTGTYKGQLGESKVNGTVSGGSFKLAFQINAQGTDLNVTYDGTFESATTVKGSLDLGGMATGTFTGKKVK